LDIQYRYQNETLNTRRKICKRKGYEKGVFQGELECLEGVVTALNMYEVCYMYVVESHQATTQIFCKSSIRRTDM
jgi:hypothetical protein